MRNSLLLIAIAMAGALEVPAAQAQVQLGGAGGGAVQGAVGGLGGAVGGNVGGTVGGSVNGALGGAGQVRAMGDIGPTRLGTRAEHKARLEKQRLSAQSRQAVGAATAAAKATSDASVSANVAADAEATEGTVSAGAAAGGNR